MNAPWIIRPIRPQDDVAIEQIIQNVMTEHGCSGEGFALHDTEVAAMSTHYNKPAARYYVVTHDDKVFGGAGFALLDGTDLKSGICELRKMYFRPDTRGLGIGHALLQLLLDEMRLAQFKRCYLETTSWMEPAQKLYRRAGFIEQPHAEGATGHHGCDRFFSRDL